MILEDETFVTYHYYPSDLKLQSNKPILAACDDCGKIRKIPQYAYRPLCVSCPRKGKKSPFFGKTHTEEVKALIRAAMKGKHPTEATKHYCGKIILIIVVPTILIGATVFLMNHTA